MACIGGSSRKPRQKPKGDAPGTWSRALLDAEEGPSSGKAQDLKGSLSTSEVRSHWQQSKRLAFLEFALIIAVYIADWRHYIFLSKIPYLLLLVWLSLRLRRMSWRDIGVGVYRSWGKTLVLGILAGVGIEMLELFCTQPLLVRLTDQMPDLSVFDRVAGNLKWLAISLAFTWTLFALGEELIFRG